MSIDPQVSLGDIIVVVGFVVGGLANYFMLSSKVREVLYKVEELRRGRGLILEHWPYAVQRCFGYRNGVKPAE